MDIDLGRVVRIWCIPRTFNPGHLLQSNSSFKSTTFLGSASSYTVADSSRSAFTLGFSWVMAITRLPSVHQPVERAYRPGSAQPKLSTTQTAVPSTVSPADASPTSSSKTSSLLHAIEQLPISDNKQIVTLATQVSRPYSHVDDGRYLRDIILAEMCLPTHPGRFSRHAPSCPKSQN